ncbi:MAG: Fluoroquinolones export ATP-binding protein [Planctomycetaceae bacterium]|nr:Fluoroquinolones export ATP-binding protein [Planctomycetaceae bacterium]
MSEPAQIRIENLVVRYGRFIAVNDLTLSVAPGELFGFLGPNGAGKSTTIKVLIGVCVPTAGLVEVAGFRIPNQLNQIKPLFGYVPDTENHIEEFTGRENLNLFADLYSIKRNVVDVSLKRLELEEAADLPVRNYSKGMRRKLLIAREILHQPKILYLDEPTANLDVHSTEVVRRLLRELASSGVTVFMTTHDMEEVEAICDRVAILAKGKLVDCDTPANFVLRHGERKVEIQFERDGGMSRELLDLDQVADRERLAMLIQTEQCSRLHTQEFHFEDVFLKLTGQVYA